MESQTGDTAPAASTGDDQNPMMKEQSDKSQQKRAEAAAKEEEARNSILSQVNKHSMSSEGYGALKSVLNQEARARLSNIAAAKPEKARQLEMMIIQMARYGQIQEKLSDAQLKDLLDKINERVVKPSVNVKFDRRRAAIDSDSD